MEKYIIKLTINDKFILYNEISKNKDKFAKWKKEA